LYRSIFAKFLAAKQPPIPPIFTSRKIANHAVSVAYTYSCRITGHTAGTAVSEISGMAQHQPIRKNTPTPGSDIPDKLYFRIGDVAKLCDVPAYVLRFWESEFPQLKPHKGGTGQRLYRRRDVEMALRIKSLLYDEGYTIPGARQVFKAELKQKEPQLALAIDNVPSSVDARHLRKLQKDLRDLHALLSKPAARAAVHPIRTQRNISAPRRTAEKLFDSPPLPDSTKR
jgi:DNA-binding transcriptional MerR regulator